MNKKALLVGINKYSGAPLRGCINDVLLVHKVLTSKYGFTNKNIQLLTDKNATKVNILDNLNWLVKNAQPDDVLYFHFSGHGSQVPVDDWTNTDETDGMDEIICNVDLDWSNPITDNKLGEIFRKTPKGVKVIAVLDCCHSGTGLRNCMPKPDHISDIDTRLNKFLPPPAEILLRNPEISIDDELNFKLPRRNDKNIHTIKKKFLVDTDMQGNAILISGCQDNQTSADAWINGKFHGALTRTLISVLSQSDFKISYRSLVTKINKIMDSERYSQNPQLEGRSDLFDNYFLFDANV